MRRLVGCICLVLLLVVPVSFEYTGQWQVSQENSSKRKVVFHPQREDIVLYHIINNIFYGTFDEPFETIAFITWRGTVILYTNQLAGKVVVPLEVIKMDLKFTGEDLTDVILIVHNHFGCPAFSPKDKEYYLYIKRNGFSGVFALWDTALNKMVKRLPEE